MGGLPLAKHKPAIEEFKPDERLVDERGPTSEWAKRTSFSVGDTGTLTALQGPVPRAVARGTLTHRQGRAADKLYLHWYRAGLRGTCGSADPLKVFGTGQDASRLCATEAAEGHYQQFKRAVDEVERRADDNGSRGDHARRILIGTVCEERNISEMGGVIGFRGKKKETMGLTILRSALNVLIKRWNI
jgi:hypothetical protein